MKTGVLDLEQQQLSYASYHHNPYNILIHLFSVPGIIFTGFLLLTNTPAIIDLPYIPPNAAGVGAIAYCTFYTLMEPVAGLLITLLITAMMVYVNYLTSTYGATANWWACCGSVAGWVVQGQ